MILDKDASGETAKVVTHQGSICVNLAELIDPIVESINSEYFASIHDDFAIHPMEVPHRNESVVNSGGVDAETFLGRINDDEFQRLPTSVKAACRPYMTLSSKVRRLLSNVARRRESNVESYLSARLAETQVLLLTPGIFTDHLGRTFNCTAYEYANWAKNTDMCRLLERFMHPETKTQLLERINTNNSTGLPFQQNGENYRSAHAIFATHPNEVSHLNDLVKDYAKLDIETFVNRISHKKFDRLPSNIKEACDQYYRFMRIPHFLNKVAFGQQHNAENQLRAIGDTQSLLRTPDIFTDYSGRTFNCTAYEYAYWAKDSHMCRLLEKHMDEETKAQILERINTNDKHGLNFKQNGKDYRSPHFTLRGLLTALKIFINGYDEWYAANNWEAIESAWLNVGKAQRDLPAYVVHKYCSLEHSFLPRPEFNKDELTRNLEFMVSRYAAQTWFPLTTPDSGLGYDFTITRGCGNYAMVTTSEQALRVGLKLHWTPARLDLAAMTHLEEVTIRDLARSRDNLTPRIESRSTCIPR